ncbi:MAG: hypothetical protein ACI9FU_000052 [Granulosicoccus sp.]|jgi:hypothetical protein
MQLKFDRHAILNHDEILLNHVGEVTTNNLLDLLPKVEKLVDADGISKLLKKRLVHLSIESLQNLQLHGYTGQEGSTYPPEFIFSKGEGSYNIISGNIVKSEEAVVLEDILTKLNSLDAEELAYLFGVVIKQSVVPMSSKGGAGLGLIDMRKKSTRKLEFQFQDVDDNLKFFSLKISLPANL